MALGVANAVSQGLSGRGVQRSDLLRGEEGRHQRGKLDGLTDILIDSFNADRSFVLFGCRETSPIGVAELGPNSLLVVVLC